VGGAIKRLYVKLAIGGSITAPVLPGDADIPTRSAALGDTILPGQQRWYQVYYRDTTLLLPGCPLPANQFNVSSGAEVTWLP
jgi:lipoprotein-anchoring transpeptidase ErfK/SrfK